MTESSEQQGQRSQLNRRAALSVAGGLIAGAAFGRVGDASETPQLNPLPYEEYARHDGLGLAELVRKQQVKPEELLEAAIARAEAVNPKINAIVGRLYDEARAAIKKGLPAGPFTGVPFVVKDISFYLAGVPCSRGSSAVQGLHTHHG